MRQDSLTGMIERIAPFMLLLSVVMVVSGAGFLLFFGYTIYQLLVTPDQVVFLNYLLAHMPPPSTSVYTINGISAGKEFTVNIPTDLFGYGRYVLAFLIFGIVGNMVAVLLSGGMSIFKVLNLNIKKSNQEDAQNGSTRNSNNTR